MDTLVFHRTWFGEAIGDEARNVSVFESLFQKFLFIHIGYVLMKHFYHNEKRGYLLSENKDFYLFSSLFPPINSIFCFLLVFYDVFPRIDDTSMILLSLFSRSLIR